MRAKKKQSKKLRPLWVPVSPVNPFDPVNPVDPVIPVRLWQMFFLTEVFLPEVFLTEVFFVGSHSLRTMASTPIDFDKLVHCTHWLEARDMVEVVNDGEFQGNFTPSRVGQHHQLLAQAFGDVFRVVWFGIVPNFQYQAAEGIEAHPAFNDGSRYGPFSFEADVNVVFGKYQQLYNVENFGSLFFYRVTENDIYSLERCEIIVVSGVAIEHLHLQAFTPTAAPCVRTQNGTWQWMCEGFESYQDGETANYYQLEFAFAFAETNGAFPALSLSIASVASPAAVECRLRANPHENASICIPFQNRWDDVRKGLTCIMVHNANGGRSTVRARNYAQHLAHHGLNESAGWAGVNAAICDAGGCNNPRYPGGQTRKFATAKVEMIFT